MRRALIAAVLFLAACGPSHPGTGYVKQREYVPAHVDERSEMVKVSEICTTSGAVRRCTPIYGTQQRSRFVPDRWSLLLENCYSQPECLTEWKAVTSDDFARFPEGKHYPHDR